MNIISAENLSKSYDERFLFKELSFGLSQGDKVALVGANGTGKTTLLKTMAGIQQADGGLVSLRKGIRASYLDQAPEPNPALTISQTLFDDANPVAAAVNAYEHLLEKEHHADGEMEAALEQMELLDAWGYEARMREVLGGLDIHDLDQLVGNLSGGQRKRVALAQLVLSEPDLILLDEPTNHLDLAAIEWLESYLRSAQVTLLMVTHDRYFLDNVTNAIVELEGGKIFRYQGNYAYFLEKKADRMAIEQAGIDKAKNMYAKELEWMRRQPKARGTKAKYRVEAFEDIKEKAFKQIRKDTVELQVQTTRQGGQVLEVKHMNKQFGGKVIAKDFTYTFRKGERLGLVGRNGVGKSTFLNLMTGRIKPDSGEVLRGQTTKIGYYTQEIDNLNPENRLIDEVKEIAEYVTLADGSQVSVSKLLEMFLFPPKVQYGYIHKLSGGERRRLQLLKVLVDNPNFLILDEPTNDLDIDTLNVLEQFLTEFPGCLVLVSHDRYFMDRLVDHLFVLEGEGRIRDYPGNYSDYRDELDSAPAGGSASSNYTQVPVAKAAPEPEPNSQKKVKLSFKEKQELDGIEGEIAALEAKKSGMVHKLNEGQGAYEDLQEWALEIQNMESLIEERTLRWMALNERA